MPIQTIAQPSDARTAIARYLKDEVTLAEGRVFRPELPRTEDPYMPRACIVVFSGGGGYMMGNNRLDVFDSVFDVACYGTTRFASEQVGDQALYALRELGHQTIEGTLLHWARIAGGIKSAIDKDTAWPFALITIQVLHSIP